MYVRKKDAVVHSYNNGFSGFAARLSEAEAKSIAQKPGVISVFPDPILQLHTTRSWDFLQYQTEVESSSGPISGSDNASPKGVDTIIGILDTGATFIKWSASKLYILYDRIKFCPLFFQEYGLNQRVLVIMIWVKFHLSGKELVWEVMIPSLSNATSNFLAPHIQFRVWSHLFFATFMTGNL